jgi:hypothetical protein
MLRCSHKRIERTRRAGGDYCKCSDTSTSDLG